MSLMALLAADHRHAAICALKSLVANVVFEFFMPDGTAYHLCQFLVTGVGAHDGAQVGLLGGEQAGTQLPIGGQTDTVATGAERLADRIDEADLADAVGEGIAARRL